MKTPRVQRIELTPLHVPFRPAVRDAMAGAAGGLGMAIPAEEPWLGGDFVVCRLTTDDGTTGLGEAFVWLPETGVSPGQLVETAAEALSPYVLGESPFDVVRIGRRMDDNVARSDVAKGLLDMACYDLMGRLTHRPAHDFMGGRAAERLPLAALIPLTTASAMAEMSAAFVASGSRTVRLKLGVGEGGDRDIVAAVRDAVGAEVRLRVDYNQAYPPDAAVRAIRAIEPFGIDCAEQPVRANDTLGMVRVQQRVNVPLMAHEGCFTLQEIVTLVEMGAVEIVGINTERPGGVTAALRAMDYAARRGLGIILHNQPLGIASAVQVHLAAARAPELGHAIELFGHVMLEDDLIVEPLDYHGGEVRVPEGPGYGVRLDEEALARYATAPTRAVEAGS